MGQSSSIVHTDFAAAPIGPISFDPAVCTNVIVRCRAQVQEIPDAAGPSLVLGMADETSVLGLLASWDAASGLPSFDVTTDLVYDFREILLPLLGEEGFLASIRTGIAPLFVADAYIYIAPANWSAVDDDPRTVTIYEVAVEFEYIETVEADMGTPRATFLRGR